MKCHKCNNELIIRSDINITQCKCPFCGEFVFISLKKATKIQTFSGSKWIILTDNDNKQLLMSKDIVSIKPYDCDFTDEVWKTCALRTYLNTTFFRDLLPADRRRICKTEINNHNNPVYGTSGGEVTCDNVFVLSIDELDMYITHLSITNYQDEINQANCLLNGDFDKIIYSDIYNKNRIAYYKDKPCSWWLRTPGDSNSSAIAVLEDGSICMVGVDLNAVIDIGGVGVRPALWVYKI